jgi:hypothetical protein
MGVAVMEEEWREVIRKKAVVSEVRGSIYAVTATDATASGTVPPAARDWERVMPEIIMQ